MMPGMGSGLRVLHAMIMAFASFKAFHTKAPFTAGIYIPSLLFVKVVAKHLPYKHKIRHYKNIDCPFQE
jgi:hypothetical protein